ncbi:MAG: hypothetical protein AB7O26_17895 [Planctomycetaceae bacterium]
MSFAGIVLMVVGLALIALAGAKGSVAMLYGVVPVTVIGVSAVTPSLFSLLSLRTPASDQGGVLGTGQSMSALARILGPIVGFLLYDEGLTYPYWFGAATMTIGIGLLWLLRSQSSLDATTMNVEPSTDIE